MIIMMINAMRLVNRLKTARNSCLVTLCELHVMNVKCLQKKIKNIRTIFGLTKNK